jgi:hypothetical protein
MKQDLPRDFEILYAQRTQEHIHELAKTHEVFILARIAKNLRHRNLNQSAFFLKAVGSSQ